MSAIAGIYRFVSPVPAEDCNELMNVLRSYSGDYTHAWSEESIFLCCHGKWITPESLCERLPYYDSERKLAITADAIIDNREDLFNRLQVDNGHRKQMTDSELILLAYERWGEDSPKHLIGDFTFMIWDKSRQLLFGARDLSGNRTLYYSHNNLQYAFCTAIAPLQALPNVTKTLNEQWLAEFLAIPGMFETADIYSTPYRNIEQLPPAHTISITSNGTLSISAYGNLTNVEPIKLNSNEEYEEAFRDVFREAVHARLRTNRGIGVALSGGLDSGTVASFAARKLRDEGKRLQAYSYVPVKDYVDWTSDRLIADERPFIETTMQYVGNMNARYLDFEGKSPLSEVDDWLEFLEMPYKYFENSFWIKGVYEQAQQEGIGVLLTGARGNFTISWGPALDYYATLLRRMKWLTFYREIQLYSQRADIGRSRLLSMIGRKAFPTWNNASAANNNRYMPLLIHPDLARKTNVFAKLGQAGNGMLGSRSEFEARKDKFNNLSIASKNGAMATKLSLRYGLQERDATNDPRVVRFCLSVPIEQYVQNGQDRSLLRRSTKHYLPDQIRLNQRTRGIQPADWVHRMIPAWRSFTDELEQMCKDESVGQFLNMDKVKLAISKAGAPRADQASDPHMKLLMHSIIVYRFIKNFHR